MAHRATEVGFATSVLRGTAQISPAHLPVLRAHGDTPNPLAAKKTKNQRIPLHGLDLSPNHSRASTTIARKKRSRRPSIESPSEFALCYLPFAIWTPLMPTPNPIPSPRRHQSLARTHQRCPLRAPRRRRNHPPHRRRSQHPPSPTSRHSSTTPPSVPPILDGVRQTLTLRAELQLLQARSRAVWAMDRMIADHIQQSAPNETIRKAATEILRFSAPPPRAGNPRKGQPLALPLQGTGQEDGRKSLAPTLPPPAVPAPLFPPPRILTAAAILLTLLSFFSAAPLRSFSASPASSASLSPHSVLVPDPSRPLGNRPGWRCSRVLATSRPIRPSAIGAPSGSSVAAPPHTRHPPHTPSPRHNTPCRPLATSHRAPPARRIPIPPITGPQTPGTPLAPRGPSWPSLPSAPPRPPSPASSPLNPRAKAAASRRSSRRSRMAPQASPVSSAFPTTPPAISARSSPRPRSPTPTSRPPPTSSPLALQASPPASSSPDPDNAGSSIQDIFAAPPARGKRPSSSASPLPGAAARGKASSTTSSPPSSSLSTTSSANSSTTSVDPRHPDRGCDPGVLRSPPRMLPAERPVAQWIEHRSSEPRVAGSTPAGRACSCSKPGLSRLRDESRVRERSTNISHPTSPPPHPRPPFRPSPPPPSPPSGCIAAAGTDPVTCGAVAGIFRIAPTATTVPHQRKPRGRQERRPAQMHRRLRPP